jgi:hypothetical protein
MVGLHCRGLYRACLVWMHVPTFLQRGQLHDGRGRKTAKRCDRYSGVETTLEVIVGCDTARYDVEPSINRELATASLDSTRFWHLRCVIGCWKGNSECESCECRRGTRVSMRAQTLSSANKRPMAARLIHRSRCPGRLASASSSWLRRRATL